MNCELRTTIDYIPGKAGVIGITTDGQTDTLNLKTAVEQLESKTHLKLNRINGSLDFENENYIATGEMEYLEQILISELLHHGSLEDLYNVNNDKTKDGDLLYYRADATCGPNCTGVNDKWVKLHAPTEDGKYQLTMTVEGGIPTLSWEKQ